MSHLLSLRSGLSYSGERYAAVASLQPSTLVQSHLCGVGGGGRGLGYEGVEGLEERGVKIYWTVDKVGGGGEFDYG